MKVLRVIGNVIISTILFALIIAFTFSSQSRSFIEGDLLKSTIKNAIDNVDKDNVDEQKKVIDEIFDNGEAKSIINIVIDNYRLYRKDHNYHVTEEDAKELYDLVSKYKDRINNLSGRNVSEMSEQEFKDFFNVEKINEFAHDSFNEFDKYIDGDFANVMLDGYMIATSKTAQVLILSAIIFFIIILGLINWSLIKWMVPTGISLIISGGFFTFFFGLLSFFKDDIVNDILKINVKLNFSEFVIAGIIELTVGILLIILYCILKMVFNKNEPVKVIEKTVIVEKKVPVKEEKNSEEKVQEAKIEEKK